jgi:hypothetical protein
MADDKELLESAFELSGGVLGTNPVCNLDNPIVQVRHSELTRADDGVFKSECPVCNRGLLLVRRGEDLKLSRYDRCVSCGQSFCYTDESIAGQALEPIEFVEKGS